MTYLLLAGLMGGGAGAWIGWPHGALASLVAAPVGASGFAFLTAVAHRLYVASFIERARFAPRRDDALANIDASEKAP